MSWNEYLYVYHKQYGGQFLAGEEDDGLLALTFKERPLIVDLSMVSAGRGGTASHVRARIPVTLAKPYKLTVGAEKALSGGVNSVLKAVPGLPEHNLLPADFGFPEVTKKRLIRTDNHPFTKLVLGSLDFRNALMTCPKERVEIRPGPGGEGLHLLTVTTDPSLSYIAAEDGTGWYLGTAGSYTEIYGSDEEKAQQAQRVETEFFPRMNRFLELTKAAYNAVTQWSM